jgi:hypothetical protein
VATINLIQTTIFQNHLQLEVGYCNQIMNVSKLAGGSELLPHIGNDCRVIWLTKDSRPRNKGVSTGRRYLSNIIHANTAINFEANIIATTINKLSSLL